MLVHQIHGKFSRTEHIGIARAFAANAAMPVSCADTKWATPSKFACLSIDSKPSGLSIEFNYYRKRRYFKNHQE
jgi:hypothetical protein